MPDLAARVVFREKLRRWLPLLWLALALLVGIVLWRRLQGINVAMVLTQVASFPAPTLFAGLICTVVAYVLVGIYEGIAVRHATGRRAILYPFLTAWIANPIGRVVGLAIVSGGAMRYRLHSAAGLNSKQIGAVILLVAMPYVLSVGWLIDIALLLRPAEAGNALRLSSFTVTLLGLTGLCKDIGWLVFVCQRKQPITIGKIRMRLPGLGATLQQIVFGVTQILLLATVLYLLLPSSIGITFIGFLGIYLVAIVAGQISNVPAGLGVIEAALLLMLPQVPPEKLLGAMVAYRAMFELLPLLGALALLVGYETLSRLGRLQWWKAST